MKLKKGFLVLFLTFLCLLTQGSSSHNSHTAKKKGTQSKKERKNIPRSALIGIKQDELTRHPDFFPDAQAEKKSIMKLVDLPSIEDSQRTDAISRKASKLPPGEKEVVEDFLRDIEKSHGELTPSVMNKMVQLEGFGPAMGHQEGQRMDAFSRNANSKLPPGEKEVVEDFLRDIERSHGELTPSVMKKVVQLEGFGPVMNSPNRQAMHLVKGREQDLRGSQRSFNLNPTTNAMHLSVLPFKIDGTSTFPNTESDLGEESQSYTSDPLPEYDFKELKYGAPTSVGSDYSDGYHNDGYQEDYNKNYDQEYNEAENKDNKDEYSKSETSIATLVGKKGDNLFNEIGRRVLLNILEKQKQNDDEKPNASGVSNLPGAEAMESKVQNSVQNKNELQQVVPSQTKEHASSSIAKTIADLGVQSLGGKKVITQEPQTPIENKLNPANAATSMGNIDVVGKVNNVVTKNVTKETTATPTRKMSTASKIFESVGRTVQTASNDNAARADTNDGVVVLKISDQGKPVSFNADTSTDGSILLKIPKKYSEEVIQTKENTDSHAEDPSQDTRFLAVKARKVDAVNTHPGNLGRVGNTVLAGKNTQLQDATQISNFVISGRTNPTKTIQTFHPTRNILPEEQKQTLSREQKTSDKLLQSQNLQSGQSLQQKSVRLPGRQVSGSVPNTQQNLAENIVPNVVPGQPLDSHNTEHLIAVLAHMEKLPAMQLGVTPFSGIPTNFVLRQGIGSRDYGTLTLKSLLKPSKFKEDSAVARNSGVEKESSNKRTGNEWSPCTVTCGPGIQARARLCQGRACSGFTTESRPCNPGPCPEQLAKEGLKLHNKFRKWHGVPPLKWSSSLAKKAQKLAQDLGLNNDSDIESLEMKELPGENTAIIQNDYRAAADTAVKQWYEEVKGYSFAHPTLEDSTKHFSQVVWKATKKIGIGLARSKSSNKTYVIALYDPPGNEEGKEFENIKMPDMARS